MLPVDDVNNPRTVARERGFVSINATTEVDLFGQCASETMAGRYWSSSGGQADFARGAMYSDGGQAFIVLHSTARSGITRIRVRLTEGSVVTTLKNTVDHVVTEYGIAKRALGDALPAGAVARNPVDLAAAAGAGDYELALREVVADPSVDAAIVLFAPSLATAAADVAAIVDVAAGRPRIQPIMAVFMGADAPALAAGASGAPRFAAPEEAVRALRRALEHGPATRAAP